MTRRGFWLALQFLTRLPTPKMTHVAAQELSRSAAWFPLVGLLVGLAVVLVAALPLPGLVAAALGTLVWIWITGALHLDGLADLSDALAAAHGNPDRFFEVLKDPHAGAFAVISIVLAVLLKFAALETMSLQTLLAVPLIAAWARLGPLAWSRWLKPLRGGSGERFAWELTTEPVVWLALLGIASTFVAPILLVAPAVLTGWGVWLHYRVGGVTGDCLGAGVEVNEIVLLLCCAVCPPGFAAVRAFA